MQPREADRMFDWLEGTSQQSAAVVVPVLVELLNPASVVDVGCGTGAWLSAFQASGVEDVLGVDGDFVDRSRLLIPPDRFVVADLRRPFRLGRTFDLALCLEVGEHLPISAADLLIDELTGAAQLVVFSAAIPGQGGVGHVNEQWPDWWTRLFEARGFRQLDVLRRTFWDDDRVAYWYRQNLLLYVADARLAGDSRLTELARLESPLAPRVVHPGLLEAVERRSVLENQSIRKLARALVFAFPAAMRRRIVRARTA
jgi:SAM-dependent methyltransferase